MTRQLPKTPPPFSNSSGSRHLGRKPRGSRGKATPKGSKKDMVPVLVGQVRGTHQVTVRVLTGITAGQAADIKTVAGQDTLR